MSLTRTDFGSFFAAMHAGFPPFAWQERLLDVVLADGRWPDQIGAPTGAGKTAVIDVHVFAQALTATGEGPRLPRRLSLVVPRRVLVDDQHGYAQSLAAQLADPDLPVLKEIAIRLQALRSPRSDPGEEFWAGRPQGGVVAPSPLLVGQLRGGQRPSRAWRDYPSAVAVICATPDMWGSRLLFRGYGSTAVARPREAGLLAFDSVVVVDEAHLARQLLCTARRVADLALVGEQSSPVPALQVVETTATPSSSGDLRTVGVEPADLVPGPLTDRLTRPKPVKLLPIPDWSSTREPHRRTVTATLADAVLAQLTLGTEPGAVHETAQQITHTVGCFVNTVSRAVEVAADLRTRTFAGRTLRVVLICGQIRPIDLDRLRGRYPGVLTPSGNPEVDVIVATQSLEVGVDLDLAAAVSELASGSALAQRAGRVNRRGLRPEGRITIAIPADPILETTRSGPYDDQDLSAALTWVQARTGTAAGMSAWTLVDTAPPVARSRRPLFQRPELAQAWHWARTSDDLAATPELDLWLADDLSADTAVSIVVRRAMPVDPIDAVRLVKDLPPQAHEMFSVPYRSAVSGLRRWGLTRTERELHRPDAIPAAVVFRPSALDEDDTVTLLQWRPEQGQAPRSAPGERPVIRPGDVIVLDDTAAVFTASTSSTDTTGFSPPVFLAGDKDDLAGRDNPAGHNDGGRADRYRADDVLTAQADLDPARWARREVGGVVLRIEASVLSPTPEAFTALSEALTTIDESDGEPDLSSPGGPSVATLQRQILATWLTTHPNKAHPQMITAAHHLLTEAGTRAEVILHPADGDTSTDDPGLIRVLLIDHRRANVDDGLRQVWSPSTKPVTLVNHQQAVADRAALLASHLGLDAPLVQALRLGGAHHDDGKQDPRFQVRLGATANVVLAKSRPGTSPERARRNDKLSGLSRGWRHEQLSVAESWDPVHAIPGIDPDLVARLVGTSHGHGRSGFPHTAEHLLPTDAPDGLRAIAVDLFDDGLWDALIETTHQRYGVWGCAYLEAVLRGADTQVSEEGS